MSAVSGQQKTDHLWSACGSGVVRAQTGRSRLTPCLWSRRLPPSAACMEPDLLPDLALPLRSTFVLRLMVCQTAPSLAAPDPKRQTHTVGQTAREALYYQAPAGYQPDRFGRRSRQKLPLWASCAPERKSGGRTIKHTSRIHQNRAKYNQIRQSTRRRRRPRLWPGRGRGWPRRSRWRLRFQPRPGDRSRPTLPDL